MDMEKKANVLFILFEGLADTVIDSQVLSHVAVMQGQSIANFEIWAFAVDDENYQKSLQKVQRAQELSGAKVRVFRGYRPSQFFSLQKNAAIIERALEETSTEFTHIHARTEYSAAVAGAVKGVEKTCLIWDCRGDAIAELAYRYNDGTLKSFLMKALRTHVFKKRLQRAGQACKKALFVSRPLYSVMASFIGDKPFEVLPCCASEVLFYFDPDLRRKIRKELGLDEGQKLYTYSGSLAPYQRFDDTVQYFSRVAKHDETAVMLVLTPDLEKARKILDQKVAGRYILKHGQFSEMNGYLNASDAGFMLRDPTPTNRVATPTKFAEYCLTGLPVVMDDAVEACFQIASAVGNVLPENDAEIQWGRLVKDRLQIALAHRKILSREAQSRYYIDVYS